MKPTHLVLHCSDSTWGDLEEVTRWHTAPKPHGNGWEAIGYHYLITNAHSRSSQLRDDSADGVIHAGRAEDRVGSHALGYNDKALGICLVGRTRFSALQFAALERLCRELMAKHSIPVAHVIGHCETEHERRKGKAGKTCPNFDVAAFRARLEAP